MREQFTPVDFTRPLDVEHARAAIPPTATVRGLMFRSIEPSAEHAPFAEYPAGEYFDVCIATARSRWPDVSLREGLRRVARLGFPSFANTAAGKVMFGVFKNRVQFLLTLGNAAARFAGMPGTVTVIEQTPRSVVLRMVGNCFPVDAMHVGALEGMLSFCGVEATVRLRETSDAFELYAEW